MRTITRKILFIEQGLQKYTIEKMQSIDVIMKILANDENVNKNIKELPVIKKAVKARPPALYTCYIIGSDSFKNNVHSAIEERGLRWKYNFDCSSEDEMMKNEHLSFPKMVTAVLKEERTDKKSFKLKDEMSVLYTEAKKQGLSDEDFAGIIFAAEEVEEMKVFPNTKENIYKVFLKIAKEYIQDAETAENAVNIYLDIISKTMVSGMEV